LYRIKEMSMMHLPRLKGVYYGWVLVLTLALTETTSWGILYYAFTVFLAPMQTELGWSRGAMTPARAALVADLYGPTHYGQINGVPRWREIC
jgi:hypothetical protein